MLPIVGTQKVSVTLESSSIEDARRLAGPRGLSSYLDLALTEKLARDRRRADLLAYLDELETLDPSQPEERARAAARAERIRSAVEA